MCIAILSTAHPKYALILISNRDEYLTRPTAPAAWWADPYSNVLGGRDLLRPVQGTWMGITKQGLIAVLTNFKEDGYLNPEARSRGFMVNLFLTQPQGRFDSTEDFVNHLVSDEKGLEGVGGFSLVCGKIGEPLAVISNRTPSVETTTWVMKQPGETVGLSNAAFSDRSWPKVTNGEELLRKLIQADAQQTSPSPSSQQALIEALFDILSTDTLPRRPAKATGWESYAKELRNSIFIPAVGGEGMDGVSAEELAAARPQGQKFYGGGVGADGLTGLYGTQKQTVVLVDHAGRVKFVERTLFDGDARPAEDGARDRSFEFDIEGWKL